MKTHKLGIESFHIFEAARKGEHWMVQFIWGKKDFRVYLDKADAVASSSNHPPVLKIPDDGEMVVSKLQYLNNFEWYDYEKVSGHGLAFEEVRWIRGKTKRYLELPKDFFNIAVEIACREFDLERAQA